jgi:hypothetical protein
MEALFDRQAGQLKQKLQAQRPLIELLENNLGSAVTTAPPPHDVQKRKLESDGTVLSKRLKMDAEDD